MRRSRVATFGMGTRSGRMALAGAALLLLLFAGPMGWPGAPEPASANATHLTVTATKTTVTTGELVRFSATVECRTAGGLLDIYSPPPEGHVTFTNATTGESFDYVPTDTTWGTGRGTATSTWVEFAPNQAGGSAYSITATYVPPESSPCEASSSSVTITVWPAASSTQLTLLNEPGDPAYIGNEWHFQVHIFGGLPAPSGSVYLLDDTGSGPKGITNLVTLDETGDADFKVTLSTAGTHNIFAVYIPDGYRYTSSESERETLTLVKYPTDVGLDSLSEPISTEDTVAVRVTLLASPGFSGVKAHRTGTVDVKLDGETVKTQTLSGAWTSGLVSVLLTGLPVGTHEVTATYSGDANYASASTTAGVMVEVHATATGLTITPRDDIEVDDIPGPSGVTVTYEKPTASDSIGPVDVECAPGVGSLFPVGMTTVTCTATRPFTDPQETVTTSFNVVVNYGNLTITDLPALPTFTAASPGGAYVTYETPQASSAAHAELPVTCDWPSGSLAPVGVFFVHCTATDLDVYPSTVTTSTAVTVRDDAPPVLTGVPDTITSAASGGIAVTYTLPTAIDLVSGPRPVTCAPASGSTFPIGVTTVACAASDASGNEASSEFTVTVIEDETPPSLSGTPEDITMVATGPDGAYVSYMSPTATDAVDGGVSVGCSPVTASLFPIGTTTVTCTASDGVGNEASEEFTVTVTADETPPSFSDVPRDIAITATGPGGAVVTYTAPTATDAVNGAGLVTCTPISGSMFALGVTTVTCTASDASANLATVTFTVTVSANMDPPPEDERPPSGRTTPPMERGGVTVQVDEPQTAEVSETDEVVLETQSSDGTTAKVVAPPGALPPGVELSIAAIMDVERLIEQAPPPTSTGVIVAYQVYAATPHGASVEDGFGAPVELSFTVPASQVPDTGARELTVVFWNGSSWVEVPAKLVMEEDGSVTLIAEVDHFTIFAIARRAGYRAFSTPLTPRGATFTVWGGGTIEDAASIEGVTALWVWSGGRAYGYTVGGPSFLNAAFRALFPSGYLSPDTPVVVMSGGGL